MRKEVQNILVCAGDGDYAEVIRKADLQGMKVFVCAVGADVSPELTSLAPFYPIERYLDIQLTRKRREERVLPTLSPKSVAQWSKFVRLVSSLEATLPFVGLLYLRDTIMPSYRLGGDSRDDRFSYTEMAKESGIIEVYEMDNPMRPGTQMSCIRLKRENDIVAEILRTL